MFTALSPCQRRPLERPRVPSLAGNNSEPTIESNLSAFGRKRQRRDLWTSLTVGMLVAFVPAFAPERMQRAYENTVGSEVSTFMLIFVGAPFAQEYADFLV